MGDAGGGRRRTLALDFDGVLHSYTRGWTGPVPEDPPEPGAAEFARRMAETCDLVCLTTRADTGEGGTAVESWLHRHGFPPMAVTDRKPPAVAYVDDRAVRYHAGNWEECARRVAWLRGLNARRGAGADPLLTPDLVDAAIDAAFPLAGGSAPAAVPHVHAALCAVLARLREAGHLRGGHAGTRVAPATPDAVQVAAAMAEDLRARPPGVGTGDVLADAYADALDTARHLKWLLMREEARGGG